MKKLPQIDLREFLNVRFTPKADIDPISTNSPLLAIGGHHL